MIDPKVLGKRIKFFRERAHLSQLELETSINASAGMISRIEKGRVNPTKETVGKIVEILGLNNKELDYLIGSISLPVKQAEIDTAITSIKEYFGEKHTFAYLLDEKWRVHYLSEGMLRMLTKSLPLTRNDIQAQFGKTILEIIFNKKLGFNTFFFQEDYYRNDLAKFQLSRYYNEVGFMVDDESFVATVKMFEKDPFLNNIWLSIKDMDINTNSVASKIAKIKLLGFNISLSYSREMLPKNPRFETIELFPTNKLLKLLTKL